MPTKKPKNPAEKFRNQTPRGKIQTVSSERSVAPDGGITRQFHISNNPYICRKKIMKNYGMPFKNAAIDKLGDKFGKDKPTHQNVDFKANAEKRVAENISTGKLAFKNTDTSDQRRKISSLKDPQPRMYVEMTENKKPLKNTLASGRKWDDFLVDAQENTSATTHDKYSGKFVNAQQKMKTLAPSYVDPKGPSTLQGVKKKK